MRRYRSRGRSPARLIVSRLSTSEMSAGLRATSKSFELNRLSPLAETRRTFDAMKNDASISGELDGDLRDQRGLRAGADGGDDRAGNADGVERLEEVHASAGDDPPRQRQDLVDRRERADRNCCLVAKRLIEAIIATTPAVYGPESSCRR